MVLLQHQRRWIKSQKRDWDLGMLADDPEVDYLLGFRDDEVEPLPVKTYIRRLWLAFQSGKSPHPKYFFNPMVEDFSKEVDSWVSEYVNDPDLLIAELGKESIRDAETGRSCSAFLEETARTMLVTRDWGNALWGERKNPLYPLRNEKRELGDNHPPQWPEDQSL
jgi:hypothetical protein